ncbi:hypothetical protein MTO96_016531 [Rhipicephalus appendiculatus]
MHPGASDALGGPLVQTEEQVGSSRPFVEVKLFCDAARITVWPFVQPGDALADSPRPGVEVIVFQAALLALAGPLAHRQAHGMVAASRLYRPRCLRSPYDVGDVAWPFVQRIVAVASSRHWADLVESFDAVAAMFVAAGAFPGPHSYQWAALSFLLL